MKPYVSLRPRATLSNSLKNRVITRTAAREELSWQLGNTLLARIIASVSEVMLEGHPLACEREALGSVTANPAVVDVTAAVSVNNRNGRPLIRTKRRAMTSD